MRQAGRERFETRQGLVNFYWYGEGAFRAPEAALLYPKYPEVRMSGFLVRAENGPSDLIR